MLSIIFYIFSIILLFSAFMVVTSRYPVRAVLFLVLAFFASSVLWMLLQAEFLALVLIFVYVGAVMTLFLFVVMMLNLDVVPFKKGHIRFLPLGVLVIGLLLVMMLHAINPDYLTAPIYNWNAEPADYSNVKQIGAVLYTKYAYPFELAALLLLVAIIAAISLVFRGRKSDSKAQQIAAQHAVSPKDRIRLVK